MDVSVVEEEVEVVAAVAPALVVFSPPAAPGCWWCSHCTQPMASRRGHSSRSVVIRRPASTSRHGSTAAASMLNYYTTSVLTSYNVSMIIN